MLPTAFMLRAGNHFCGHIPEQSAGVWHEVIGLENGQQILANVSQFETTCYSSRTEHFSTNAHSIFQSGQ